MPKKRKGNPERTQTNKPLMERKTGKIGEQIKAGRRDEKGVRKIDGWDEKTKKQFPISVDRETGERIKAMCEIAIRNTHRKMPSNARFQTREEMIEETRKFWEYIAEHADGDEKLIPDLEGYCAFLGIPRARLLEWERTDHLGLRDFIQVTKNDIIAFKKMLAMNGEIPPLIFAIDANNNHGYVQSSKTVHEIQPVLGDARPTSELASKYMDAIEEHATPEYVSNAVDMVEAEE